MFFNILKYITNKDNEGLNEYFEWVLKECLVDKDAYFKLSNIEKFLILLDLRSYALGDKLQLNGHNNITVDYQVSSIRNNIINKLKDIELSKKAEFQGITLFLSAPKNFVIDNLDQLYKELIDKIKIGEEIVNFYSLTDYEKESIINNIPANLSDEILSFINLYQNIGNNISIISDNTKLGIDKILFRVFDNTLFTFIKSIYNDELINFYELQYNMISKMNISYEHFLDMTPNECKIHINFYNVDMKRQEEAQTKSNTSTPSLPSMPKFK
jgi:hypothetical protein